MYDFDRECSKCANVNSCPQPAYACANYATLSDFNSATITSTCSATSDGTTLGDFSFYVSLCCIVYVLCYVCGFFSFVFCCMICCVFYVVFMYDN